jgi:hypothetical protein
MAGLLTSAGAASAEELVPSTPVPGPGGSAVEEPASDGRASEGRKAESERVC